MAAGEFDTAFWDHIQAKSMTQKQAEAAMIEKLIQGQGYAQQASAAPINPSTTTPNTDLNKVWEDEGSRAMEILGGEPPKMLRDVKDVVKLEFTVEQWRRIFNLSEGYFPADTTGNVSSRDKVHVSFVRIKSERT